VTENLQNLIIATPVIGVLLFFLNYFMKSYEVEKKINKERDKQDSDIIVGLKGHVKETNKKLEEINRKLEK
jgi:hypothetical protein